MPDSDLSSTFRLNVSGSTVYACLKNLLVNDYGFTRTDMIAQLERTLKVSMNEFMERWVTSDYAKRIITQVIEQKVVSILSSQLHSVIKVELEKLGRLKLSFE